MQFTCLPRMALICLAAALCPGIGVSHVQAFEVRLTGWEAYRFGMTPDEVRKLPGVSWSGLAGGESPPALSWMDAGSMSRIEARDFEARVYFDERMRLRTIGFREATTAQPFPDCERRFESLLLRMEARYGAFSPRLKPAKDIPIGGILESGRFASLGFGLAFHARGRNADDTFAGILIEDRREAGERATLAAQEGKLHALHGGNFLSLERGSIHRLDTTRHDTSIVTFVRFGMEVPPAAATQDIAWRALAGGSSKYLVRRTATASVAAEAGVQRDRARVSVEMAAGEGNRCEILLRLAQED